MTLPVIYSLREIKRERCCDLPGARFVSLLDYRQAQARVELLERHAADLGLKLAIARSRYWGASAVAALATLVSCVAVFMLFVRG